VRVSREQAAVSREAILQVAGRLFQERGFDGVGIAEIMKEAGFTHGGFYKHFSSKAELAQEITSRAAREDTWFSRLVGRADPSFRDVVRAYLSARHREDVACGCFSAALSADVARQPAAIRHEFTKGLRKRIETLSTVVRGDVAYKRRQTAVASMASLVGALVLSRAVDDPKLASEILAAVIARSEAS
jgi:TetR/AcrR family transcriptional regulator, transcriptional repressor for nem operon